HDKPRFIMTLSITNHPPYRLPKDVEIQKIKLDKKILDRFPYDNTETIFATFRYANDELGKFINAVKEDVSLKDNIFIAATGDHNMRGIGYSDYPEELVFGHEVPFYLYMPEKYIRNTAVRYDPQRLGSHKDIITTLVSHALSDYTFYSFGCDMLSNDKCNFPYAYNQSVSVGYGKDYACELQSDNYGISYKITDRKHLLVSPKADDANCTKEAAFKRLETQLYYFQAMMPVKLEKIK
ncbi:MAG: sulfatase-like hydrolase/transferase, partial [Succinivibrio sp.]|nr:sulfatase-like hydrolase/transferase [Succinivibrio sp.]